MYGCKCRLDSPHCLGWHGSCSNISISNIQQVNKVLLHIAELDHIYKLFYEQ